MKKQNKKIDNNNICEPLEKIEEVLKEHINEIDQSIMIMENDKKNAEDIEIRNLLNKALNKINDEKQTFKNLLDDSVEKLKDIYSCKSKKA